MSTLPIPMQRGVARAISDIVSQPVPSKPISVTQKFIPWIDGKNITGADQWGFTWFSYPINFSGINTNGKYFITNSCDAYIILGDQPISVQLLNTYNTNIVPPMTSGIYDIGRDAFNVTCLCAGYDFATKRTNPGPNSPFSSVRGSLATVSITSLGSDDAPSSQPPVRTGWQRIYDWYDLTSTPNSPISVIHGAFWNSPRCDFTGSKGVTAAILCSNPSGCSITLVIYTNGPSGTGSFYALGSANTSQAGNAYLTVSSAIAIGTGPYIQVINNDTVNPITITDANLEVAF